MSDADEELIEEARETARTGIHNDIAPCLYDRLADALERVIGEQRATLVEERDEAVTQWRKAAQERDQWKAASEQAGQQIREWTEIQHKTEQERDESASLRDQLDASETELRIRTETCNAAMAKVEELEAQCSAMRAALEKIGRDAAHNELCSGYKTGAACDCHVGIARAYGAELATEVTQLRAEVVGLKREREMQTSELIAHLGLAKVQEERDRWKAASEQAGQQIREWTENPPGVNQEHLEDP